MDRALKWIKSQNLSEERPVLCADTCVALDSHVLGKPQNKEDAQQLLKRMSGRAHYVYTAQALAFRGNIYSTLSTNKVFFRDLTLAEIQAYCSTDEPFGKA